MIYKTYKICCFIKNKSKTSIIEYYNPSASIIFHSNHFRFFIQKPIEYFWWFLWVFLPRWVNPFREKTFIWKECESILVRTITAKWKNSFIKEYYFYNFVWYFLLKCMFGTNSICYQRPKAGYETKGLRSSFDHADIVNKIMNR